MSLSNFQKVSEFNEKFGVRKYIPYISIPYEAFDLAMKLIEEEKKELDAETRTDHGTVVPVQNVEIEQVLKEAADLLYVIYGMIYRLGFDADEVFDIVHKANMTKLGADGKPVYRADGKVTKSPLYVPADLSNLVLQNRMRSEIKHISDITTEMMDSGFSKNTVIESDIESFEDGLKRASEILGNITLTRLGKTGILARIKKFFGL